MIKYIAQSPAFNGDLILGYDDDGFLAVVEVAAKLDEKQWAWLGRNFPVTSTALKLLTVTSKLTVKEMPNDLSFDLFWKLYNYKVGDKKATEKSWNLLPEVDKVAALAGIPRYLFWLSTKTIEQSHAKTWLNQRRWENEYKK